MPATLQAATRIFEDPYESTKSGKHHKRVPSVGDVLRGRKIKGNGAEEFSGWATANHADSSPLGERHLNSPPQPRRVLLKDSESRPTMHKKTSSSVSLKGFMTGKGKACDSNSLSSEDGKMENHKPKKMKSSTNLSGLLRKRSKKDLQLDSIVISRDQTKSTSSSPVKTGMTPIWAQYATPSVKGADRETHRPQSSNRSMEQDVTKDNPRDYSEYRPSEQGTFRDLHVSPTTHLSPHRPFLEHKNSRSSIFKEEMEAESESTLSLPRTGDCPPCSPASPKKTESRPPLESQPSNFSQLSASNPKRASRVLEAIQTLNKRSRKNDSIIAANTTDRKPPLSTQELDFAFERVLDSLNIPDNMREGMRNLKADVKVGLMKGERIGSGSSVYSITVDNSDVRSSARSERLAGQADEERKDGKRSRSRSRPRSGILSMAKRDDNSPFKKEKGSARPRSKSRPRSMETTATRVAIDKMMVSSTSSTSFANLESAITPGDFIHYLREVQKPEIVEIGKLHKLRLLLRNESVAWTDSFVMNGGMDELVQLLYRTMKVEWREDHEDTLLHENLLCLKALCTTDLALQRLAQIEDEFFPALFAMLFDEEKKGPSEFATRGIITWLLFQHLSAARTCTSFELEARAMKALGFLRDPTPDESKKLPGFISQMHLARPYKVWCKEVVNVTKEVFWIFLHHMNVIPINGLDQHDASHTFVQDHFPPPRPPHPAAPYVGGVEWEATQYLSIHLDVLNGVIASLPTRKERNSLREDLKQSGWEKAMGSTLRTCKEKFYGCVHEGLKIWVSAAKADEWPIEEVRAGPPRDASSPKKSPVKKKVEEAPKLALDVCVGTLSEIGNGWV